MFKLFLPLKRILLFCLITLAWIFFRAENISQAFTIISSLNNNLLSQVHDIITNNDLLRLKYLYANLGSNVFLLSILFSFIVMLFEWKQQGRNIVQYFHSLNKPMRYSVYLFLIYGSIFFGVFEENQFIYFQF